MKNFLSVWPAIFLLIPAAVFSQTYTTSFPATENPISEGGKWTNGGAVALDWQNVETTGGSPGTAYSTGICNGYDDCIAILSGYPADHSAQATVFRQQGYTAPSTHEVELLLRFKLSAHSARGYEMDFWFGGSTLQIVRWNGPIGDFTVLNATGPGPNGLVTGDVVKAQMVGSTITVYKNGNLIATCVDAGWKDGNPGMGFFVRPGGTLKNFCFSRYSAAAYGTGVESGFRLPAPGGFSLGPNSPNPFRSGTTFSYEIPSESPVSLKIYDLLGREVAAPVNGGQAAGHHEAYLDGSALPAGAYTLSLSAGHLSRSRKIVLLK